MIKDWALWRRQWCWTVKLPIELVVMVVVVMVVVKELLLVLLVTLVLLRLLPMADAMVLCSDGVGDGVGEGNFVVYVGGVSILETILDRDGSRSSPGKFIYAAVVDFCRTFQ